jgi:hypothetical protein
MDTAAKQITKEDIFETAIVAFVGMMHEMNYVKAFNKMLKHFDEDTVVDVGMYCLRKRITEHHRGRLVLNHRMLRFYGLERI